MSKRVQLRRGTTTEHSTFTGVVGEVTIDTTKDTAVVHDGSTVGGHPLSKQPSEQVLTGYTIAGSPALPAATDTINEAIGKLSRQLTPTGILKSSGTVLSAASDGTDYLSSTTGILKSTYDAHTILYATTDNTPVTLTVGEQTVIGRATGGNISALSIDSDLSSVSVNDDTVPSAKATKAALDLKIPYSGATTAIDFNSKTISNTGNVGIGQASGSYALGVNGKIAIGTDVTIYNATATYTGSLYIGNGGASSTTGSTYNTGIGNLSLNATTVAGNQTAGGYNSLASNVSGSNGVAFGFESQRYANNTATPWTNYNTSAGYQALRGTTTASANIGNYNTAMGYNALLGNKEGNNNSAFGYKSMNANTDGDGNSAVGALSLFNLIGKYHNNTAVGYWAGLYYGSGTDALTQATQSTFLGASSRASANTQTNEIVIGYNAIGAGTNKAVIGNSSVTDVYLGSSSASAILHTTKLMIPALNIAPASAGATGTTGDIRICADYIYVCVATNTWVRTALTTWA